MLGVAVLAWLGPSSRQVENLRNRGRMSGAEAPENRQWPAWSVPRGGDAPPGAAVGDELRVACLGGDPALRFVALVETVDFDLARGHPREELECFREPVHVGDDR